MLIPVFVSMPNSLNDKQFQSLKLVFSELGRHSIEARTLGRSDYPTSFPLREVLTLANHCSGGLILGFSQFKATTGVWKNGTPFKSAIAKGKSVLFPTPWNQLEAGILFAINVPLLVFREEGVAGGVFDIGATDLFIHNMPNPTPNRSEKKALREVFQKWSAQVRAHYYGDK
jgi:hypothetical protein